LVCHSCCQHAASQHGRRIFILAAREVDWQIWINQGDRPYPCRYAITSTNVPGDPQYTIDVRNWKSGDEVASARFSADIPAGAKKLNPGDLTNFDDVPAIFTPKGEQ
jgi:hypothetical protein